MEINDASRLTECEVHLEVTHQDGLDLVEVDAIGKSLLDRWGWLGDKGLAKQRTLCARFPLSFSRGKAHHHCQF